MIIQILAGTVVKHVVKPQHTRDAHDDMEYVEMLTTSEQKISSVDSWTVHRGKILQVVTRNVFVLQSALRQVHKL